MYARTESNHFLFVEMHDIEPTMMPTSPTHKVKQLQKIKQVKQDPQVKQENQADQGEKVQQNKLEARLKQLDQYKQIHQQQHKDDSSPMQEDETGKEKIREVNVVLGILSLWILIDEEDGGIINN